MDSIYLTPAYKLALAVFGFLGFYNTWGRTIINGTLVRLLTAIHGGPYELPGTDAMVMRTSFTGIYWPIDWICNVMIVFFWEVVDGSHPTTTAIGLYFIGQHLSIVTTMYVDSYRSGHKGKALLRRVLPRVILHELSKRDIET